MTRSQSTQVFNQGITNSKQDNTNAQTALSGVNSGLQKFQSGLDTYFSSDPYKTGGEFQQDQSNINAARANANSAALRDAFERHGATSGENTTGYASNLRKATQQSTLDEATAQANADAARLGDETRYQQFGVEQQKFPVQAEESVYGTSLGSRDRSLGTAGSAAANNKSFGDTFGQEFGKDLADSTDTLLFGPKGGGGGGGGQG